MRLTIDLPPWLVADVARTLADPDRVGHALLVHGQAGVGKRAFARAVARGLLCESDDPAARRAGGCGTCAACRWFAAGHHPDFRRLTSEAVAAAEGDDADAEGDDGEGGDATARGRKSPSREIKVDQVRALQRFLAIATHRHGLRVVLMYPLEALNAVGANALLKMLEEPPPATVFLLVADRLGTVPATIVSRCRRIGLHAPAADVALAWLRTRGVADAEDALALAGGAPYAALEASTDGERAADQAALVRFLGAPDEAAGAAAAEALSRGAQPGAAEAIVHAMQRWLADCIAMRLAGRLRYHPAQAETIARLARRAPVAAWCALMQRLVASRRVADHPLNLRLFLEGLLGAYARMLSEPSGPGRG